MLDFVTGFSYALSENMKDHAVDSRAPSLRQEVEEQAIDAEAAEAAGMGTDAE